MPSFADRFFRWRNRLVADMRFQRWAAGFPLTRWVARRQSQALFDMCAGFVYSQVLSAIVALDVLPKLAAGPLSVAELAPRIGLAQDAAQRLLKAATALGLTQARGQGRYDLGLLGAALLGNPGVIAMIRHHGLLYADLADPVALLRGRRGNTALAGFWPYATGAPDPRGEAIQAYSSLMSASQTLVVDDILEAYPFARHRVHLDVGGGDGTFLTHVARACPDLSLMLFDLPGVAARAEARFLADGLAGRARAFGGDMSRDRLPEGADLVTLVRVLHDHDDDRVRVILAQVRAALAPEGTLLVAEPMAGVPGAEAMADAYFGFYLLAMGSGRARTPAELGAMLREAGFVDIRALPTRRPLLTSAMTARPG